MSQCFDQSDFSRFARGEISGSEAKSFHQHLGDCETCRKAFEQFTRTRGTLVDPVPSDATQSLDAALSDSSPVARMARHFPRIEGYQITGVIGQGGMGIVYRAVQTKLNRVVALKVLPAIVGSASPSAVARFRREATAAARLHHTNIIPIYDFGESRDAYFYAMELVTGQPVNVMIRHFAERSATTASAARLAELLQDNRSQDSGQPGGPDADGSSSGSVAPYSTSSSGRGRLYYQQVARWMADAADALHYAHGQGIIHRDIKPSNLILSSDGRIMVADFGLAKSADEESVTLTGSLVGTLRYISPEQAMAKRVRVDHRTDIYSLGATMYELLCFVPAFPGVDDKEILGAIISRDPVRPRKVTHAVPPELEVICMKTLEKSPDARYDTARALAEDLRRYINDLPIVARRPGLAGRSLKFIRRRKASVIAVTATLLAAVSTLGLMRYQRDSRTARVNSSYQSGMFYGDSVQREWERAKGEFELALSLDPNHVPSLIGFARAVKEIYNDNPESQGVEVLLRADEACRKALSEDPENIAGLNLYGVILKMLGRFDDAIAVYERLLELTEHDELQEPHYAAAWSNKGMVCALKKDLACAEDCLQKGARLAGTENGFYSAVAWRNLASCQLFLKKPEAAASLDKAMRAKPDEVLTGALRARLLMTMPGQIDGASALLAAQIADSNAAGTSAVAKRMLALAAWQGGNLELAERSIQAGMLLDDRSAADLLAFRLTAAALHARKGNSEEARFILREADRDWPEYLKGDGEYFATAERGDLWFESADEMKALREDVQSLLETRSETGE